MNAAVHHHRRLQHFLSSAIKLLHKSMRPHIHHIYGFVRFADEIVDSFHDYDKAGLFADFKSQTYVAIEKGISLEPHSTQFPVNRESFIRSTGILSTHFSGAWNLTCNSSSTMLRVTRLYIYGSAEVGWPYVPVCFL